MDYQANPFDDDNVKGCRDCPRWDKEMPDCLKDERCPLRIEKEPVFCHQDTRSKSEAYEARREGRINKQLCVVCMRWYRKGSQVTYKRFYNQLGCSKRCAALFLEWFTKKPNRFKSVDHDARNREIVKLYNKGGYTYQDLAEKYGIKKQQIGNIVRKYK